MLLIVPKLSESVKNTQLLKHLAKCQVDEQVLETGFEEMGLLCEVIF